MSLPCLAHEPYPTIADFRAGWQWWLQAAPVTRHLFSHTRLQLVRSWHDHEVLSTSCHSTGSTGSIKHYRWGPCYDALYSWFLHDLVRAGSRLDRVAVLTLLGTRDDSLVRTDDTPWHPIVDRWIKVGLGRQPLTELGLLLAGHDVIIAPGHFEILDRYAGLAALLDRDCLILSTAEAITPYVYSAAAGYGIEVRDWMRCWDGGASFFTCPYGSAHLVELLAEVAVRDGQLISSDLFNLAQPFLDYHNGDRLRLTALGPCPCGLDAVRLEFVNRQDDLYMLSPTGATITYTKLSFLMARAAVDAGLSEDFDLLCFGYSRQRSLLELGYLRRDLLPRGTSDFERRAAAYGRQLGFAQVVVSAQVESAERKFKRFYDLDLL